MEKEKINFNSFFEFNTGSIDDFEQKVVQLNENLSNLGLNPFSSFGFDEYDITNPFYDIGYIEELKNPFDFYGIDYINWKNSLKELMLNNNLISINNDILVITKFKDNEFSFYFDNVSFRGSKHEVIEELKSIFKA